MAAYEFPMLKHGADTDVRRIRKIVEYGSSCKQQAHDVVPLLEFPRDIQAEHRRASRGRFVADDKDVLFLAIQTGQVSRYFQRGHRTQPAFIPAVENEMIVGSSAKKIPHIWIQLKIELRVKLAPLILR